MSGWFRNTAPQVDSTLNTQQRRDDRRTERLYQEWKEGVYDPIHSQLKAKVMLPRRPHAS